MHPGAQLDGRKSTIDCLSKFLIDAARRFNSRSPIRVRIAPEACVYAREIAAPIRAINTHTHAYHLQIIRVARDC